MLEWYRKYQTEITWAIIGWLAFAVIDGLMRGNFILSLVNLSLIFLNYFLWKKNQ